MEYITNSPVETEQIGAALAKILPAGTVIAYRGDLGAGKTAFTRGLAKGLGCTDMRNERIRTYNFPQGRVTDHRVNLTLYKIDAVMDGALDEIIDALATADQAEKLKNAQ